MFSFGGDCNEKNGPWTVRLSPATVERGDFLSFLVRTSSQPAIRRISRPPAAASAAGGWGQGRASRSAAGAAVQGLIFLGAQNFRIHLHIILEKKSL